MSARGCRGTKWFSKKVSDCEPSQNIWCEMTIIWMHDGIAELKTVCLFFECFKKSLAGKLTPSHAGHIIYFPFH